MAKINIADVKKAFVQGATPNEGDYQALINLAAVGYKALGNDTADGKPGAGLEMDNNGKLQVKEGPGITVSADGVAAKVDDKTVGINKDTQQLEVKLLSEKSGLDGTGGLHVKTGPGIKADKDGISVNLAANSGLRHDVEVNKQYPLQVFYDQETSGLTVDGQNRLTVNVPKTVSVNGKMEENYLTQDKDGLYLTDTGIEKMKDAMASVSITALTAAVKNTNTGAITDTSEAVKNEPKSVEAQIAVELNNAYQEGWSLDQARKAVQGFLSKNYARFKSKTVADSSASFTSESSYLGVYTKAPKDGDAPLQITGDCMLAFKLDSSGTLQDFPRNKGQDNVQDFGNGLYIVIGKLKADGTPAADGDHYTQFATMFAVSSSGQSEVGLWDMSTPEVTYSNHPLRDPGAYYAGYHHSRIKTGADVWKPEGHSLGEGALVADALDDGSIIEIKILRTLKRDKAISYNFFAWSESGRIVGCEKATPHENGFDNSYFLWVNGVTGKCGSKPVAGSFGLVAGDPQSIKFDSDISNLGRFPDNDVVLDAQIVSGHFMVDGVRKIIIFTVE
ncbi:hypothetical protein OQ483_23750 (plasmid) [Enterobacter bugandensis]|uniref:hypothetical protein n=1 Tax=Enterobacter bugandensis TaxID=881260 RepID=UPI00283AB74A|nr:hypothetical protein [Enterobacter bugandensis]WMU75411.1 hypothetical protein OQ483_23750 [Enterobacter bugandensis]